MSEDLIPLNRFWQPRHWPVWLLIGILRLVALLPYKGQLAFGRGLGKLMHAVVGGRRFVAERNIALCFPDMPADEQAKLVKAHFESLGMMIAELGMMWWMSDDELDELVEFEGLENLTAALEGGRGVILLSGHFAANEITGRSLSNQVEGLAALYRPSNNPFNDQIMRRVRSRATPRLISKEGMRDLLFHLRDNGIIWYAPDQSFRRANSVMVKFFDEPAPSNPATSQLSRMSRAAVVPYLPMRKPDGKGYLVRILPALDNFPSSYIVADTRRFHALLEEHIEKAPAEYYWVHKRFKGRSPEYSDVYAKNR